jgi:hypothetical protein
MSNFKKIVTAIKEGYQVKVYGSMVRLESADYRWQSPELWIVNENKSSYKANNKDLSNMEIEH